MTDNAPQTFMTDTTTTPPTDPAAPQAAPDPANPNPAPADSSPPVEPDSAAGGVEGQPPAAPTPLALEDIPLPEGFEMPEEIGGSFLELMNNPPESRAEFASKMIEMHTSLLSNIANDYAQQWEATQEQWREQIRALPEIGGDNLARTQTEIAKVLDRYGDQEARDALAITGAGNHPALVKLFHAIAKDLNEAPPVVGTPPTGAPRDRASRMFQSSEG